MEVLSVSMVVVTLWETFGWLSVVGVVVGLVLLAMLVRAILRRRKNRMPVLRLLWRGVLVTLVAAAILTPFVPVWTMAPVGDLRGWIDVLAAYSMALPLASIAGVIWIYLGSFHVNKAA